jgi:hypothetical protein
METNTPSDSGDQDWRLKAELHTPDARGSLDHLMMHLRPSAVVRDVEASVGKDAVITHDGELLFAYASTEAALKAARSAIEDALRRDEVTASVYVSHWDDEFDDWRQTDPPLRADERQAQAAADRDAETIETRTLVASVGKMIRAEFEQSLLEWAEKLGVECKLFEHPHLLTKQVGFTVTGPKHKLDEFAQGLAAEERQTIRAEGLVLASPL